MRQGKAPYTTTTFTPFRNTESAMPYFPMLHFRHAGGGGRSNGPYADSLPLSSQFQGGGGGLRLGGGGNLGLAGAGVHIIPDNLAKGAV